jgi:hypothetical protein
VGFLAGLAKQDMFSYLEILGAGGGEVPNDDLAKTFLLPAWCARLLRAQFNPPPHPTRMAVMLETV